MPKLAMAHQRRSYDGTILRKFGGVDYRLNSQHDFYIQAERAKDAVKALGYKARIHAHSPKTSAHPYWVFIRSKYARKKAG